jgi:hypothetical protein
MNMLPNSVEPSAAFRSTWHKEEARSGVRLVKRFVPAEEPETKFGLMLLAMCGTEELAQMLTNLEEEANV